MKMAEETVNTEVPSSPLTPEVFSTCLSEPRLTLGCAGVAFTKLDVSKRRINAFGTALQRAGYVRYIQASSNPDLTMLRADELLPCKELITLDVAGCSIKRLGDYSANPTLQHLDLTANNLVSLQSVRRTVGSEATEKDEQETNPDDEHGADDGAEGAEPATVAKPVVVGDNEDPEPEFVFAAPSLLVLLLNRNKLVSFEGLTQASFRNLVRIEAANNDLTTLHLGEELPSLKELVLPRNKLKSLTGIASFPNLQLLNVDFNEVDSLRAIVDVVKGWGEDVSDDASVKLPLGRLAVLSLRNNAVPEDSWANLDGLRPLSQLQVRTANSYSTLHGAACLLYHGVLAHNACMDRGSGLPGNRYLPLNGGRFWSLVWGKPERCMLSCCLVSVCAGTSNCRQPSCYICVQAP